VEEFEVNGEEEEEERTKERGGFNGSSTGSR